MSPTVCDYCFFVHVEVQFRACAANPQQARIVQKEIRDIFESRGSNDTVDRKAGQLMARHEHPLRSSRRRLCEPSSRSLKQPRREQVSRFGMDRATASVIKKAKGEMQ